MMYLTPSDAKTRLIQRYGMDFDDVDIMIGDVMIASDALDQLAPFDVDVDVDNLPDQLLDWVALKAHVLSQDRSEGAVSDSVGGVVSHTYAWPQLSRNARRLEALIAPYLKRSARVS